MNMPHLFHHNNETDQEKFQRLQAKLQELSEQIEEAHQYKQGALSGRQEHYMAANASYEYWEQRMTLLVAEREKILAKIDERTKHLADTALGSR